VSARNFRPPYFIVIRPLTLPTECVSREVRQNDAIGFEDVAGAAGEIGGVKVYEAQNDVVRREFAFPLDDSRGKRSFAAQINSSQRHFRSAKASRISSRSSQAR